MTIPRRPLVPALLIGALALRLAHLHELRASPFFEGFVLDEKNYDAWAQRIAAGDILGEGTLK